ncbi:MAG: hypothetical protein AAB215_02375, partial [Planctomycetota bacterium]
VVAREDQPPHFQTLLAGVCMAIYLRGRGLSTPAVLLGAWAFMLNGVFVTWLELGFLVGGILWLPLAFWGADRIAEGRVRSGFAAAAFACAAQWLGGSLQFSAYFLFAAFVYAGAILAPRRGEGWTRALRAGAWTAFALVLGTALAAIQILPTLDLVRESSREMGKYKGFNFIDPLTLLGYLFVDPFGNPGRGNYVGGALFGNSYLGLHIAYVGAAAIPLSIAAGLARRSRALAGHALYAVAPLLFHLLLGWGAFDSALSRLFPLLNAMPGPRMMCLLGLALSFGIAEGWQAWRDGRVPRWLPAAWAAAITVAAIACLPMGLRIGTGLALGLGAAVLLALRPPAGAAAFRLAAAAWLAFALCDLLWAATGYNPFTPLAACYPETPSIAALRTAIERDCAEGRPARFLGRNPPDGSCNPWKGDMLPPASALAYGLPDVRGKCGLLPMRTKVFFSLLNDDPRRVRFDSAVHFSRWDSPLLDLANVRYILSADALSDPKNPDRLERIHDGPVKVYRNRRALERVFAVRRTVVATDAEALRGLADPAFDPRETAFLDRPLPASEGPLAPGEGGQPRARILECLPERLVFETESPREAVFVVSDAWDKDWTASLDGEPATLARADFLFRAVRAPAGRHRFEMDYRPRSFRIGAFASAAALALGLLLLALSRRRRAVTP